MKDAYITSFGSRNKMKKKMRVGEVVRELKNHSWSAELEIGTQPWEVLLMFFFNSQFLRGV